MTDMALPPPGFDRVAIQQSRPAAALRLSRNASEAEIDKAAKEFEAVFVTQMLSSMWEGVGADENFGGGHAEETYRGLLMEQYGKEVSKAGGFGLADHVKRSLLEAQEMAAQGGR
ncbi:rod-binding protein [Indioceanicola profundi]|uniref:rod-binding protein n=1 Tax=Indioceanicola profundi TaxID=2220096 RepID=UPI000E6AA023|nr:rod-binding protein [Indioceanicola profundi]